MDGQLECGKDAKLRLKQVQKRGVAGFTEEIRGSDEDQVANTNKIK